VNIVMLFVWGFSAGTNPSKRNFCRAYLIWMLIGIVLFVLFLIMGGMAVLMGRGWAGQRSEEMLIRLRSRAAQSGS
jgi:hypothetical protein